jgi:hypothetical protein
MSESLTAEQLECAWMTLAVGITSAGREQESKFLAKLALLLVTPEQVADLPRLVGIALRDL